MAKISTYPSADTPLLLSDRLIGTEAPRIPPSPTPLATKNFSLSELLNLFSVNFPAASLQEVLNTGNTATQDIYLTGTIEVDLIKPVNIEDPTGSQGTTFQYLSKGTSSINWVNLPVDNLQAVLNSGNTATQNITLVGNVTSTYVTPGNIKDELLNTGAVGQVLTKSTLGVQWKNSSVPSAPSLGDVLFTGNSATNDINLTGNMYATTFVKSGGTSSQFLKADGSVDSSTYALASSLPTLTSDLTNDGDDGINPFISLADVPAQVNSDWNATSGVAEILNKPTIPSTSGFVPYTGATQDVDLGEFELKAGQIEFDQTPTGTAGVAVMRWNDSDGTVDVGLKGGNVTLQVGQESVLRVVNKTATNVNLLEANYQAVRVTGAQGQRLKVDLAQATNDTLSAETIGLVTETINNNQEGFITTSGLVRGINTTGSLQGETWVDGDVLYLSPTTAGNATKVKPTAPNHLIILGYVIHAHINQGSIFVKVDNGYELDELHNVKITTPANNNVLAYTSATDIWENKTVATALGFTAVPSTRNLTINGTTQDLSADRTFTIATGLTVGTTAIASGTVGRVLFQGTGNVLQQNGNLFWDNTNGRLGIFTATPTTVLDVNGTTRLNGLSSINGAGVANTALAVYGNGNGAGNYLFRMYDASSVERFYLTASGNFRLNGATDTATTGTDEKWRMVLNFAPTSGTRQHNGIYLTQTINQTGGANGITRGLLIEPTLTAIADYRAIETTAGNVLFGASGTGLFWDNTNSRLGIGTATPTKALTVKANANDEGILLQSSTGGTLFQVTRDGASNNTAEMFLYAGGAIRLAIRSTANFSYFNGGNFGIGTTTDAGFKLDVNGTTRISGLTRSTDIFVVGGTATTNTANARFWSSGGQAPTSGLFRGFYTDISFIPSSGNAEWYGLDLRPTINQTGGASGVTRGLYIAATLTAAADFRAIEVASGITVLGASTTAKASLRIPSGTAPTSPVNGDIWFDGTDIKMRIGGVTKTFTLI